MKKEKTDLRGLEKVRRTGVEEKERRGSRIVTSIISRARRKPFNKEEGR
jgi:hypothetical protein